MATEQKLPMLRPMCNCDLLEGRHFEDLCQKKMRAIVREQNHREWLEQQERNAIWRARLDERRASAETRQVEAAKRRADWERRYALWQEHEARRAAQKVVATTEEASTVASEDSDGWTAPIIDMMAPAKPPAEPRPAAVQHPTFTADEWKELLKVKKVLRDIAAIDDLVVAGKKVDALQLAKLSRRSELEGCLVMYKDRAGYAKPC